MGTVHNKDIISPYKGIFSFRIKDRNGLVVYNYSDNNMIVTQSKLALSYLVSEANREDKIITQFGIGTGQTAATPSDTMLENLYIKPLINHDFPEPGRVRFHWALEYGEANGVAISEFGLFCSDGTLFARKVRGTITKEEDLSFEGEWTIVF